MDAAIRGSGTVTVDHPTAEIEAEVVDSGPLGVRLDKLRVAPRTTGPIDLVRRTHDIASRLRPGGERLEAVEVDPQLGGGTVRTDRRDLRGGRYFQVDVGPGGEAELHRVRVDPGSGERQREPFALTREHLEELVDGLAAAPREDD